MLARIPAVIRLTSLFAWLALVLAAAGEAVASMSWPARPPWTDAQFRDWPQTEADANHAGESDRWRMPAPARPDWPGLARDTGYFLGYQFVAIGILYVAPETVSGWSAEDKANYSFDKWKENVRDPVWDQDVWWINYVLHPYWGAAYYVRGRERGLERVSAFWYSALLSTLFEYGAEALFEKPSYQDLLVTPVAGSLIGEYWFAPLRDRIKAKPGRLTAADKTLLFLTDPLGVLNAEADRLFGLNLEWRFSPLDVATMPRLPGLPHEAPVALPVGGQAGIQPVWGLQLRIVW